MSITSIDSVRICQGVDWESVSGSHAKSYFPEHALDRLAAVGLDGVVLGADLGGLSDRLGERISAEGAEETEVRALKEDASLVVKLAQMPFSYLAANVALEAALGTTSRYRTPAYLGTLVLTGGWMVTIMSRAEGKSLKSIKIPGDDHVAALERSIQDTAQAALPRLGIRPTAVYWDLNENNVFVPTSVTQPSDLSHVPVTIIDQTSPFSRDADGWYAKARITADYGDPRDREAEAESERAWAQYAAVTAA
ncbi:MAG TPA: hypothetical protein VM124_02525 [Candidatus Limnocylindrales bacterium]|nr:hypothetical protein [Candidatus Limnocylindrales bacterium]